MNKVRVTKTLISFLALQVCCAIIMAASGFNFSFPVPNQEATLDDYYMSYALLELATTIACIIIYVKSNPYWDNQ